ncbi:MAG TPA: hypothetical protein VLV83_23090 [Acidobacteriota bacterium]|nr:hypothetical protein [Acidobacteriota bacterium]
MGTFLSDMMPRFQAMSVTQILDATLRMYARHFPLLAGITAVAFVPYYLFVILVLAVAQSSEPGLMTSLATLVMGLGLLVIFFVLSPLSIAATLVAVSERYLDRPVSILSAFRMALQRFLHIFLAYMLLGLMTGAVLIVGVMLVSAVVLGGSAIGGGGGFFFMLVFGTALGVAMTVGIIALFVIFSMMAPAVLLEQLNAIEAMRRSIELTRDNRVKIFAVFAVLYVVIFVAQLALMLVAVLVFGLEAAQDPIVSQVVQLLGSLVATPLFYTSVVFVYYELRIRKEAFDLDYLSRSLDAMEGKASPPTPDVRGGEQPDETPASAPSRGIEL